MISNAVITGGIFNIAQEGQEKMTVEQAIKALYLRTIPGALHNSGERFDAPKCHPNTRVAVIEEVLEWLDITGDEEFAMWINGAAGAGKSAICQAIAQICFERGRLTGSFFFSRTSMTGRNSATGLVATLAYQVLIQIPQTRPFVAEAIAKDLSIFELSWERQLDALIVKPLSYVADEISQSIQPQLFLIDGLDECDGESTQSLVVRTLITALKRVQHTLPHKLLIASRPETYLVSTFGLRDISGHLRRLRLDNSWEPDEDIRRFLVDNFAEIKEKHPLGSQLDVDWPNRHDVEQLVDRSSGQFIYASTVIRYIKSDRHHPVERLKVILGIAKDTRNRPFAELDALYQHIFTCVDDIEVVLRILCIILLPNLNKSSTMRLNEPLLATQHLLGLSAGMVELHLNALASVIEVLDYGQRLSFMHASLPDFLADESRSGRFYLHSDEISLSLAKRCFAFCLETPSIRIPDRWSLCFNAPMALEERICQENARDDLFAYVSQYDWKPLLDFLSSFYKADDHKGPRIVLHGFLEWLIRKNQELLACGKAELLSGAFHQISSWIMTHVREFAFSGFDNPHGIDLIALAACFEWAPGSDQRWVQSYLRRHIYFLSISDLEITFTPPTMVCLDLYHRLGGSFFTDRRYFGEYALNGYRYAHAAANCLRSLTAPNTEHKSSKGGDFEQCEALSLDEEDYARLLRMTGQLLEKSSADRDLYNLCRSFMSQNDTLNHFGQPSHSILQKTVTSKHKTFFFVQVKSRLMLFSQKFYPQYENGKYASASDLAEILADSIVNYVLTTCKYFQLNTSQSERVYYDPDAHIQPSSGTSVRWASWWGNNILRWMGSS